MATKIFEVMREADQLTDVYVESSKKARITKVSAPGITALVVLICGVIALGSTYIDKTWLVLPFLGVIVLLAIAMDSSTKRIAALKDPWPRWIESAKGRKDRRAALRTYEETRAQLIALNDSIFKIIDQELAHDSVFRVMGTMSRNDRVEGIRGTEGLVWISSLLYTSLETPRAIVVYTSGAREVKDLVLNRDGDLALVEPIDLSLT